MTMPAYSRTVQIPGKSSQELYDKVSADIERFLSKVPMGKCDIERQPDQKKISVKSSMFSANLSFQDGQISLDVKLGLLAAPFRGKLDEGIDQWLSKSFS
jgi:hypothetical protein